MDTSLGFWIDAGSLLQASITFPELITSSLLGLDALLANSFAAGVTKSVQQEDRQTVRHGVCLHL